MTARAVSVLIAAAGLAGAAAPALGDAALSLEATSELLLQPATQQGEQGAPRLPQPELLAAPKQSAWEYDLDFIFWWPWDIKATPTAVNVTADVDANPGDMFNQANSYAPEIRFEAWNKAGWGISVVGSYHYFDNEGATGNVGNVPANTLIDSEVERYTLDVSAGFRLLNAPADSAGFGAARVDAFAGLRYGHLDVEQTAQSNQNVVQQDDDWLEPIFGLRTAISIRRDLWWMTRFDISGGGTAWRMTDLTWMLDTGVEYRIGERMNLLFGYRVQQIDYDTGKGDFVLTLDGTFQGPYLGLNFGF
ncbi:MAG: hypothetical protein ACF8QF_00695 [Phycisphaerales bacterium]